MSYYSLLSWGITIFLLGAAVTIYRPDLLGQGEAAKKAQQAKDTVGKNIPKKVKNNKQVQQVKKTVNAAIEVAQNTAQSVAREEPPSKKRKPNGTTSSASSRSSVTGTKEKKTTPSEIDNNTGDREFALQLAQARAGTKLQSSAQQAGNTLSRLSLATSARDGVPSTSTSSTTGQDADDDLSSLDVPNHRATSGKDVTDMLEKPDTAPSSLRITSIPEDKKKQPQPRPPQFEQVETKKQRQARLKREEQKRMIEESNKIHEAKKQEQLRTARTAAGTSNQTKADNFAVASKNVWQNKSAGVMQAPAHQAHAPLLDTFTPSAPESESITTKPLSDITGREFNSNSANVAREQIGEDKTSALAASKREGGAAPPSWSDQVSEEEQMQRLRDATADDAWESVTNKKSKKKSKADPETGSEASFTQSAVIGGFSEQAVMSPVKTNTAKTNGTVKATEGASTMGKANRFDHLPVAATSGLQDDEWGLDHTVC